ncbi:reverse transcriptase domain-containing protein [Artemisia annua]|uniref:Reverse transcriptase domain-containing protein n=1 Tax=Artemisia annua TaxID=35608 RepID=A0A2U1PI14_ARTAN|nr:reverse transcriptase domain-containing protein [Artemisia annua]
MATRGQCLPPQHKAGGGVITPYALTKLIKDGETARNSVDSNDRLLSIPKNLKSRDFTGEEMRDLDMMISAKAGKAVEKDVEGKYSRNHFAFQMKNDGRTFVLGSYPEVDLDRNEKKENDEVKRMHEKGSSFVKTAKHDHERKEEAKVTPNVVTSILQVNSIPTYVLFDLGASMYFMSHDFSERLSTPLNKLPTPLEVEIADSKVVSVSNIYLDNDLEIDDCTFKIDLIPMMLGEFDVVVSMDWLSKYNANILCTQKIARVVNPSRREINIYGEKTKGELTFFL